MDIIPDSLPVICGELRGVLLVREAKVVQEGREMGVNDFEREAGRGSAKKWRHSVRVLDPDGDTGLTLGDWLEEHGADIRNNKFMLMDPAPPGVQSAPQSAGCPAAPEPPSTAAIAQTFEPPSSTAQPQASELPSDAAKLQAPELPSGKAKQKQKQQRQQPAEPGPLTMEAMREHLQGVLIGYRAGDPTVGELPAEVPLPSAQQEGQAEGTGTRKARLVRLRDWSVEQLMQEAASTMTGDLFGGLFPEPPGVPPDRIAYITGQNPPRRRLTASRPPSGAGPAAAPATAAAAPAAAAEPSAITAAAPSSDAGIPAAPLTSGKSTPVSGAHSTPASSGKAGPGRPKRATPTTSSLSEAELVAVLGRHLGWGGSGGTIPWADLGMPEGGPQLQGTGQELDLRRLWSLVTELGGCASVTADRKWSSVAAQLGKDGGGEWKKEKRIGNGGTQAKAWYHRFLLPYEQHLKQDRPIVPSMHEQQAAGVRGGGDVVMGEPPPLDVATLQTALAVAMGKIDAPGLHLH